MVLPVVSIIALAVPDWRLALASLVTFPLSFVCIQQAISELTCGKTIITIARRLATIQNADRILVVDDGRVAECGTHDELIGQDGLYKRFTEIRQRAEGWQL